MAYKIKAVEAPSGVSIDIEVGSLLHRMGTGQTVNGFYNDSVAHTARWSYCGKEYSLAKADYDFMQLAKDYSGFCGYNSGGSMIDFYNEVGELICSYSPEHDTRTEFPLSLGKDMILYFFVYGDEVWWIYQGERRSFRRYIGAERTVIGFHSKRYIKELGKLRDSVYDVFGNLVYRIEYYPFSLSINGVPISIRAEKAKAIMLERYNLIAVCEQDGISITAVTLYDLQGCKVAEIPLPENTVAFHSIKLLEHTDIPVISCYEELPSTSRYVAAGEIKSVRHNMLLKLRWYEVLPNQQGRLTLYKSGELYQGFNEIDPYVAGGSHLYW